MFRVLLIILGALLLISSFCAASVMGYGDAWVGLSLVGPPSAKVGDVVRVDLYAASTTGQPVPFCCYEANMWYDPTALGFQYATDAISPYQWMYSGFMPAPPTINYSLTDGDFRFTGLAMFLNPPYATPDNGLLCSSFYFRALKTGPTGVNFLWSYGTLPRGQFAGLPACFTDVWAADSAHHDITSWCWDDGCWTGGMLVFPGCMVAITAR